MTYVKSSHWSESLYLLCLCRINCQSSPAYLIPEPARSLYPGGRLSNRAVLQSAILLSLQTCASARLEEACADAALRRSQPVDALRPPTFLLLQFYELFFFLTVWIIKFSLLSWSNRLLQWEIEISSFHDTVNIFLSSIALVVYL